MTGKVSREKICVWKEVKQSNKVTKVYSRKEKQQKKMVMWMRT